MTDKTYLLTISNTLRDKVAPHVDSSYGRLALLACRHMLLRLANPQQDIPLTPFPFDRIPPELREALSNAPPRPFAKGEAPSENPALAPDNAGVIDSISSHMEELWSTEPELVKLAVDWEGQLQDAVELYHDELDTPRDQLDSSQLIDPKAVEAYLLDRFGEQLTLTSFTQLLGGRSKQTALLTIEGSDELPTELVIRRDQSVETKTGSIIQEYPVIKTVYEAGVAVARPILLETSPEPMGKAFAILGRVEGQSLGTHFDVPKHREIALGLAEQVARLHAIPINRFQGIFPEQQFTCSLDQRREQLAEMREAWESQANAPSITMAAAFRWLEENMDCAEGELALIHGDLGFHNFMFEDNRFIAILDWETAHPEHPAGDLGYLRPAIEKMLPWEEFMAHYVASGGRQISARQIHFFGIWEILRINIALRHCRVLFESGATDDPMLGEVGAYYVPRFIQRISQHLRQALRETRGPVVSR